MAELSRRKVLGAVATTAAAGLAGCLDSFVEDNGENDSGAGDGGDGDQSGDNSGGAGVSSFSATTTNTDCASGDSAGVQSERTDSGVRVTGTMEAPDPCHVADVASATLEDGELSVAMVTQEDDAAACGECIADIEYEATVELADPDSVEEIHVTHDGGDEYTLSPSGSATTADNVTIQQTNIETVNSDCGNDEEDVKVTKSDGSFTVDGKLSAPDPCHEAALDSTTFDDGELSISVNSQSTLGEDEMCQQCLGRIEYEATVDVVNTAEVTKVSVSHVDGDSFSASWRTSDDE